MSHNGVVLENGAVRLAGTGTDVLNNPEIGALYLGGSIAATTAPVSGAGEDVS